MLSAPTFIKRITLITAGFFTVLLLAGFSAASGADLNSKHDLCTGSNLTVQDNAGCNKVKDANGNFVDAQPTDSAASKFDVLVNDVINLASIIIGVAAVVMIIYGGFRILTSAGNPENNKTGRNAILYALLGLVIVAFAQTIVKLVLSKIA